MVDEETFAECPNMVRLREELDARGIEWVDNSEVRYQGDDYKYLMLRTAWTKLGFDVSVIWGYIVLNGVKTGTSFGFPELLECWWYPNDREPLPMTVEEILEVTE